MKKYIISIFTIFTISLISYFGYQTINQESIKNKNKECYNDIQKIKPILKKDYWDISEQKYSSTMGTCIYYGRFFGIKSGDISWQTNKIIELYTDKIIQSSEICIDKESCNRSNSGILTDIKKKENEFKETWNSYK